MRHGPVLHALARRRVPEPGAAAAESAKGAAAAEPQPSKKKVVAGRAEPGFSAVDAQAGTGAGAVPRHRRRARRVDDDRDGRAGHRAAVGRVESPRQSARQRALPSARRPGLGRRPPPPPPPPRRRGPPPRDGGAAERRGATSKAGRPHPQRLRVRLRPGPLATVPLARAADRRTTSIQNLNQHTSSHARALPSQRLECIAEGSSEGNGRRVARGVDGARLDERERRQRGAARGKTRVRHLVPRGGGGGGRPQFRHQLPG
mmetsp:Transcript_7946/g.27574  ORF Transcript_7946/g.27574 Transcript_7946/m.27574 type:complete len:260 (+) Transcript_7946:231-1010(+)